MNNVQSEQEKAQYFLDEVERLWPTNRELVVGREFFEIWENSCEPRPFSVAGPTMALGKHKARLPGKEAYVAWLTWNHDKNGPSLIA